MRRMFWAVVVVLSAVCPAAAQSSVLAAWDRNTDAYTVGYRLYYGTASKSYQWSLDTGGEVSATLSLSPGRYYFAVRAYNATNDYGPPSDEVVADVSSIAVVDCSGTWSAWLPLADWSACVNGQQSRTESRTFTILVYPSNGGAACPSSPETRIVTQACVPPPPTVPTCTEDPLDVTVRRWPSSKKVTLVAGTDYVSDYPVTYRYTSTRGQSVLEITFIDSRGCIRTTPR